MIVEASIASLNVAVMAVLNETDFALSAGLVDTIVGAIVSGAVVFDVFFPPIGCVV